MSFQKFPFNLPTQALALIDKQTGQPTNFFWQYLLSMFNRTGAGNGIVPIVKTGLTATGLIGTGVAATASATQSNSLALGADWNQITNAPAGGPSFPVTPTLFSGVVLPAMNVGNDITIWNDTANKLLVYPPSGSQIGSSGLVNASITLNAGELAYFQCWLPALIIIPYTNAGPL